MAVIVDPQTGNTYYLQQRLGCGAFGEVFKAYNPSMHIIVALKMIKCHSQHAASEAVKEATLHAMINHSHIVKCYAMFYIPNYMGSIIACLVEEYCDGGTLADRIRVGGYDTYHTVKSWTLQMLSGLIKIHQHNIIHRDIKTQNIFLKGNVVKIGDLGIAVARFKVGWNGHELHQTMNGDDICVAPEMFAGKPYDIHVDVFGAGLILLALITRHTRPMYMNMSVGRALYQGFSLSQILHSMHIGRNHVFRSSLEGMLAHSRRERLSSNNTYNVLFNA